MADDWIVEHLQPDDVVVTNDIPLADRCLKKGACAIKPTGKVYTEDSIGDALATRDLLTELRSAGVITGGPPPLKKCDRSLFLQQLALDNPFKRLTSPLPRSDFFHGLDYFDGSRLSGVPD